MVRPRGISLPAATLCAISKSRTRGERASALPIRRNDILEVRIVDRQSASPAAEPDPNPARPRLRRGWFPLTGDHGEVVATTFVDGNQPR
jgi:hypothetical protein